MLLKFGSKFRINDACYSDSVLDLTLIICQSVSQSVSWRCVIVSLATVVIMPVKSVTLWAPLGYSHVNILVISSIDGSTFEYFVLGVFGNSFCPAGERASELETWCSDVCIIACN